jgi:hypothetical protein
MWTDVVLITGDHGWCGPVGHLSKDDDDDDEVHQCGEAILYSPN